MFYTVTVFSVFISALLAEEELKPIVCDRDSIEYNSCLKLALQAAWPLLVSGLPKYNLQTLDPLFVKYSKFVFKNDRIHGEAIIRNTLLEGIRNTQILMVELNHSDNIFHLKLASLTPEVYMDTDFEATGDLGGLKLNGKGHFNFTAEDVKVMLDIKGHIINDTLIIEFLDLLPTLSKFKINFKNFFGGNEELNNLATIFVNEFWPMLYRLALPEASKVWNIWFKDMISRFSSNIPFSKIFS